ncbi:MAG: DUF2066 domain-containing protein [SAR86 cluster bacterium]|uniref:DUF2066 domain-containing protein n=1 Tax=SAR86 cluster bacterium TaxID=2030880 RepID=A0A520MYB0_9GAMM|nr:MAG: DUF2066 domain-containing protein [SAR86 cluster bacterium]
MRYIKHTVFCLIIFSNTCFGKEFDKLFTIYTPIEDRSQIENSINKSFNTMIYRLSGKNSPTNIWKIINAGNSRKDFIKSYSVVNNNENNLLEVNFNKNLLISKFKELSIPFIGSSRPTILFLIKIDSGLKDPYYLSFQESDSDLEKNIKNYLTKASQSRGIFLELPELDLLDLNNLNNYEKIVNSKQFFGEKYLTDEIINIDISKTGINKWSVSGDIRLTSADQNFNEIFIKAFSEYTDESINLLLNDNLIDITKVSSVNISIENINSYQDYKKSKKIIEDLVGTRDINISKFNTNTIYYQLSIYGDLKSIIYEFKDTSLLSIVDVIYDTSTIQLKYKNE